MPTIKYSSLENTSKKAKLEVGSNVPRPISSPTANWKANLQVKASEKVENSQRFSHLFARVRQY